MGSPTEKRTQVLARYTLGNRQQDRYDVTGDYSNRFTKGLTANGDRERDVITFTLTSHLKGRRADAWAYSVGKGEMHGPPCGDCICSGRMQRG